MRCENKERIFSQKGKTILYACRQQLTQAHHRSTCQKTTGIIQNRIANQGIMQIDIRILSGQKHAGSHSSCSRCEAHLSRQLSSLIPNSQSASCFHPQKADYAPVYNIQERPAVQRVRVPDGEIKMSRKPRGKNKSCRNDKNSSNPGPARPDSMGMAEFIFQEEQKL